MHPCTIPCTTPMSGPPCPSTPTPIRPQLHNMNQQHTILLLVLWLFLFSFLVIWFSIYSVFCIWSNGPARLGTLIICECPLAFHQLSWVSQAAIIQSFTPENPRLLLSTNFRVFGPRSSSNASMSSTAWNQMTGSIDKCAIDNKQSFS